MISVSLAVALLRVEANPLFARRDVTGDKVPETFCNQFIWWVCWLLGVPLPAFLLARHQIGYFHSVAGQAAGWSEVDAANAIERARLNHLVIATWLNPVEEKSSHVAVVIGGIASGEAEIAQAGAVNFSSGPLSRGFGRGKTIRYFAHPLSPRPA